MSRYVSRDGSRLTRAMLRDLNALDQAFAARFGKQLHVNSGVRLRSEQEQLFRERYVPSSEVNGRRTYDFRQWQGIWWARISDLGTVAAPDSPHANHVIENTGRGALDLRDDGVDAGVSSRENPRADWLKANALAQGYSPEGYNFSEPWHYRYERDPWVGTGAISQEETMAYPILLNGRHRFLLGVGSIKHFTDVAASDLARNIVAAEDVWIELNTASFLQQLDSFGVPRDKVDTSNGHVFDVTLGRRVAGGWWSWAREAQHNTKLILAKLG
ncbi:hypothetical protein [Microbacterium pumilum]|uniref:Peptidase M15B domain-containing protein n=1 Tax=Microbacterium pumilum TaxID=344165 RepID=A0ABN2T5C7_9MICO